MAQRGGKRAGAGRKKGSVSKAKLELADMAKGHASEALETLVNIMRNGEQEGTRLSAANAILDRGYGKPYQAAAPEGEGANDSMAQALNNIADKLPG